MIELAILGLLTEQDLHGYELKKQLGELLGSWSTMSFGSLYPALARLEKAGLVKAVEANTASPDVLVPMTGALSGELAAFRQRLAPKAAKAPRGRRGKKVFGITNLGRDRFHELLTEPGPDDERTFALRVAFCRHLEPAERLALFDRRRAELTGQLASRRKPAERRGDLYRRSLRDRDARTISLDLEWLDELTAATHADADAAPQASDLGGPGGPTRPFAPSPSPSPSLSSTISDPTPGTPAGAA